MQKSEATQTCKLQTEKPLAPKDSNKGFMSSVSRVGGSTGVHSENTHIGLQSKLKSPNRS